MSTIISIIGVLLSLAALIVIPIWLKKKGKGKNLFLRIIIGLGCCILIYILTAILANVCMTDEEREIARVKDSLAREEKIQKQHINDSIAAEEKRVKDSLEAERNKPIKSEWVELTSTDDMTDATNVWRTLISDNYHEFDFPYNGGSRLRIEVRYRKQDGNQVMLYITRGQLMETDYFNSNYVVVRFDDDSPINFTTKAPADYSSDVLFLSNPRKFIDRAKIAHRIRIQVPVFDNGQPVFEFEPAEPLKWDY